MQIQPIIDEGAEPAAPVYTTPAPSVLTGECSWTRLFSDLQMLLSGLGFAYFDYSAVARAICHPDSKFSVKKMRGGDVLGTVPPEAMSEYYKKIAQHDPLWTVLPAATEPFHALLQAGSSTPLSDAFWGRRGIGSRYYVPVGDMANQWFNFFTLFHPLSEAEFRDQYHQIDLALTLRPMLERCHKLLTIDRSHNRLNPFFQQSIFSSLTLEILRLTAEEGLSVKQIAPHIGMTEEGITYHLMRAKEILQARNKPQLIAKLYQTGILS